MERIVIHDLRRYKLVMGKEQSVETRSSNEGETLKEGLGMESKLTRLLYQMPLQGWVEVKNPDVVFEVADINRVKVSSALLKEMNPSAAFFERRKKMRGGDDKNDKKKREKKVKKHQGEKAMADPVKNFAKYFDHTNLSLSATDSDIAALCDQAKTFGFHSVVVYPSQVYVCKMCLEGTDVKTAAVVGFPHGRTSIEAKEVEIVMASQQGADEVDIVMDYTMIKEGHYEQAVNELRQLMQIAQLEKVTTKIIVETCELSDEQKIQALKLCESSEADYIKTSTGFGSHGALVEDVELFRDNKEFIKIKASGGIKTLEQSLKFIKAGASRLGTSSSVSIMKEFIEKHSATNILPLKGR